MYILIFEKFMSQENHKKLLSQWHFWEKRTKWHLFTLNLSKNTFYHIKNTVSTLTLGIFVFSSEFLKYRLAILVENVVSNLHSVKYWTIFWLFWPKKFQKDWFSATWLSSKTILFRLNKIFIYEKFVIWKNIKKICIIQGAHFPGEGETKYCITSLLLLCL